MSFEPKFFTVFSIEEAADWINKWNEDYPSRVGWTHDMIEFLIKDYNSEYGIPAWQTRAIQGNIMRDLPLPQKGRWRTVEITVNGNPTPHPLEVPVLMEPLFPVYHYDPLEVWYKQFQLVHPFVDGNGRVAGVIIAALSYIRSGGKAILAPWQ